MTQAELFEFLLEQEELRKPKSNKSHLLLKKYLSARLLIV
jgi:hypothetical protein